MKKKNTQHTNPLDPEAQITQASEDLNAAQSKQQFIDAMAKVVGHSPVIEAFKEDVNEYLKAQSDRLKNGKTFPMLESIDLGYKDDEQYCPTCEKTVKHEDFDFEMQACDTCVKAICVDL